MNNWRYKLKPLGLVVVLFLQACGSLGLYKPFGNGPFPAVIVLSSSTGTHPYTRKFASSLSGNGYVIMVLDYNTVTHGKGRDPDVLKEELQIIAKSYDLLKAQPAVDPDRIGMVGSLRAQIEL